MKWSEVEITDLAGKVYNGDYALIFCKPIAAVRTNEKGFIEAYAGSSGATTDNLEVRKYLFSRLKGKAKSLRFLTTINFKRDFIPAARADLNVFNVDSARLKVEIVYKGFQEGVGLRNYLVKDSIVLVKALREGVTAPLTMFTKQGVADFGKVFPGKYTIAADYSTLQVCKYDWSIEKQDIVLEPATDKTVSFMVEPLYQKVQLVAHCLLAVPDFIFDQSGNDQNRMDVVTGSDGRGKIVFKTRPVQVGMYTKSDLKPLLPPEMGEFNVSSEGLGTFTLKKKTPPVEYWRLEDIDENTLNPQKIEIGERRQSNPDGYDVKFKEGFKKTDLQPPLPPEMGEFADNAGRGMMLNLKKKLPPVEYWKLEEIDKIYEIIEKESVKLFKEPNGYEFKFKEGKNSNDLKLLLNNKAQMLPSAGTVGKVNLNKKPPPVEYWRLEEIDENTLNSEKIEITKPPVRNNPDVYNVKFKPRFSEEIYELKHLESKWKGKYHGLLSDREDMDARVNLVRATLDQAYTNADDHPTILKVFMLPECYFQGRYGAYLVEDADHLLTQLSNLVSDVRWRDWMFVFGTVNLTFGQDIREMMNYSPVIRGGLGSMAGASGSGGQKDKHLRLIQKLINSAELLDAGELIPPKEKEREPSVNEGVQFQATQNEEKVRVIIQRLLDKDVNFENRNTLNFKDQDFGERKGLGKDAWTQLKAELEKNVSKLGLTRVVRSIRVCKIEGNSDNLSEWGDFSGYENKAEANLEPKSCVAATCEGLILRLVSNEWIGYPVLEPLSPGFNPGWKRNNDKTSVRRKTILADIKNRLDELVQPFGITLQYQKDILGSKIQELLDDDAKAIRFGDSKPAKIPGDPGTQGNFAASIYPIWKKILELYCVENSFDKELLTPSSNKMDYRDYCFASRRKAGPWLPLEEAVDLEPCKRLIFGLEICADHGGGRIKNALALQKEQNIPENTDPHEKIKIEMLNAPIKALNAKKEKVKIDIQLVPSAGFFPTAEVIVARKGGYCFNCDGWNKGHDKGVNFIESWFDGPRFDLKNPVYPHTAIAKGGTGVPPDLESFKPTPIKLAEKIPSKLGAGILNRTGLGELHVYEPCFLPDSPDRPLDKLQSAPTAEVQPKDAKPIVSTLNATQEDGEM